MKLRKTFFILIIACILTVCLCACSADNKAENTSAVSTTSNSNTLKEQMDIAMKNASNKSVLAKVNNIEITQTDKDVYLISGENYSTEEIVKFVVKENYAKQHGLKTDKSAKKRIDSMKQSMENDKSLTNEYCLSTYGISKSDVINHMVHRSEQIQLNSAFSDMVIEQVSSGECPTLYPELKSAYNKFQKEKSKKGAKAWNDIEQAYYDMIAKDYDIVIYKK